MKLDCPLCSPDKEKTLSILSKDNSEYYLSTLTNDGTKKWYSCENCNGVYCRDKITARWQLSPQTYTSFVSSGIIEDRLSVED